MNIPNNFLGIIKNIYLCNYKYLYGYIYIMPIRIVANIEPKHEVVEN